MSHQLIQCNMHSANICKDQSEYLQRNHTPQPAGSYITELHFTHTSFFRPVRVFVARKFVPRQAGHRNTSPSSCSPLIELKSLLSALGTLDLRRPCWRLLGSNNRCVFADWTACRAFVQNALLWPISVKPFWSSGITIDGSRSGSPGSPLCFGSSLAESWLPMDERDRGVS